MRKAVLLVSAGCIGDDGWAKLLLPSHPNAAS
jgi:hypothetical protein